GGGLQSSWDGDCPPRRDFPMLVDLHLPGRLPLGKFVSGTIGLGGIQEGFAQMGPGGGVRGGGAPWLLPGPPGPAPAPRGGRGPVPSAWWGAGETGRDRAAPDEPLYAFYLDRTGLDHPGRDAVIASQPADWGVVLAALADGPLPGGAVIGYAKHMTHHLLP